MDIKEFDWNLKTVRGLFEPLLEVGVFKDDPEAAKKIAVLLGLADRLASDKKISEAITAMLIAEVHINEKVQKKPWLWKVCYLHWLPLWAYYLICFFLTLLLALFFPQVKILDIPFHALLLGALGAELRGLYWLQDKVGDRMFRPTFLGAAPERPLHRSASRDGCIPYRRAWYPGAYGKAFISHHLPGNSRLSGGGLFERLQVGVGRSNSRREDFSPAQETRRAKAATGGPDEIGGKGAP
jgi:hypothetical protein